MPTYTSPFTGDVIQQTDVSYYALDFDTDVDLYWPLVINPTQVPAARIMDCTPDGVDLNITLPNAQQGSVGIDILFRNFGAVTFFVMTLTVVLLYLYHLAHLFIFIFLITAPQLVYGKT
jgi:hypothetical protein